jgi:DNA polymerase III subunit beta
MLFEIQRDQFLDGLSKTVPITEKRTPLPILSHILLESLEHTLSITANDLEVGLKLSYECNVQAPGRAALPARKLLEIIRELPQGILTIESLENNRVKISSLNSFFELSGMEPDDYPAWLSFEGVELIQLEPDRLLYMLEKTLFASSNDDSRFNLNGVLLEKNESKTRFVSTDGHRLALIEEDASIAPEPRVIAPKKGLTELKRLLEGLKEQVGVGFEQKNLLVKAEGLMMSIRLVDGDYPDYRRVLPKPTDCIAKADRISFLKCIKRMAVFTSERNKGVNIEISKGKIELSAHHPDFGTAKDELDVEYEGPSVGVIINAFYLMEALGVIDTELVFLEFHEDGAPVVLKPDADKNYFNLVMPMRK